MNAHRQCVAVCRIICFVSLLAYVGLIGTVCAPFEPRATGVRRRLIHKAFVAMARWSGIRIDHDKSSTLEHLTGDTYRPVLLLANHVSYLDILVLGACFPTAFLAKLEVKSWPLIGFVGPAFGCEYVCRERLESRVSALLRLRKRMKFETMCVFPEGSTTAGVVPSKDLWQSGQLWSGVRADVPLVSVGLHYDAHEAVAWVGDMEFFPHLWWVFNRPFTSVSVTARVLTGKLHSQDAHSTSPAITSPNSTSPDRLAMHLLCTKPALNVLADQAYIAVAGLCLDAQEAERQLVSNFGPLPLAAQCQASISGTHTASTRRSFQGEGSSA